MKMVASGFYDLIQVYDVNTGFYGSDHCPITMELSLEPNLTVVP